MIVYGKFPPAALFWSWAEWYLSILSFIVSDVNENLLKFHDISPN